MRQRLQGKVAVITGAASGIGEAAVELFVDQGCQVLAADKNEAAGGALVERLGREVQLMPCDLSGWA